jgi:hypothetical protein
VFDPPSVRSLSQIIAVGWEQLKPAARFWIQILIFQRFVVDFPKGRRSRKVILHVNAHAFFRIEFGSQFIRESGFAVGENPGADFLGRGILGHVLNSERADIFVHLPVENSRG